MKKARMFRFHFRRRTGAGLRPDMAWRRGRKPEPETFARQPIPFTAFPETGPPPKTSAIGTVSDGRWNRPSDVPRPAVPKPLPGRHPFSPPYRRIFRRPVTARPPSDGPVREPAFLRRVDPASPFTGQVALTAPPAMSHFNVEREGSAKGSWEPDSSKWTKGALHALRRQCPLSAPASSGVGHRYPYP